MTVKMKTKTDKNIQNHHLGGDVVANDVTIKAYEKPVLLSYGDVRDITLGPTIGEGESGCAFFYRSGPGGCPMP